MNFDFSMKKKKRLIRKDPEIILSAPAEWKKNKEEFDELILFAIECQPEIIFKFIGRRDFKICKQYVETAVKTYPRILIDLVVRRNERQEELDKQIKSNKKGKNKYAEIMSLISDELFIDAIIKDPTLIAVKKKEINNFNSLYTFSKSTTKNGVEGKKFKLSLRDEILCALRILYCVSNNNMEDDLVKSIVDKAKKDKNFLKATQKDVIIENVPTVARALIKNKSKKVTKFTNKALAGHNYRIAYELMDLYAENLLQYKQEIANMPIRDFNEKIIKKLLIRGISRDPKIYLCLDELGFNEYKNNNTIKYHVYKSLKKHFMLSQLNEYLSEEDIKRAKSKYNSAVKRKRKELNEVDLRQAEK